MEFIDELLGFGLTRQEATIYNAILVHGEMTGYEVAKQTGISRSNTYTALAGLVEKGAAYAIEGSGKKYMPVDLRDFTNNKIRNLKELRESLLKHAPSQQVTSDGYITIKGEKHIMNQFCNMFLKAEKRIYLTATKTFLAAMKAYIQKLVVNGIKVVVITDDPEYNSNQVIVYHSDTKLKQVGIIVDSIEVLTGELNEGDNSTCLYTKNKNFVDVFKEMLSNKIKLIEIQGGNEQ